MAPPPKYIITRKLIKRYARGLVPRKGDQNSNYLSDLVNCLRMTNYDMNKCADIIETYDNAKMEYKEYKKKVSKKINSDKRN